LRPPQPEPKPPAPNPKKQLAREIYKQFVEIPSGFTTGATTPVAEAAAARLKAAGFPDADIFLGGASPQKKKISSCAITAPANASRCCSSRTSTSSKPNVKTGVSILRAH